jgi:hypothetical protein
MHCSYPYGVDDHCTETVALIRTPPLLLLQSLQSPFLLGRGKEVAVLLAALEARGFCLRRLSTLRREASDM